MKQRRIFIFSVLLIGTIAFGLILGFLDQKTHTKSSGFSAFPVSINEIMSNNSEYYDSQGNAYDWVELYNSSNLEISLSQYKLTDNERKVRYTFPNGASIPAKGFYVVWCKNNVVDGEYADFSISKSGGETIILMNSRSIVVDRVVTMPLEQNTTMARDTTGKWEILQFGTPGYENTEDGYKEYVSAHQVSQFSVRINELMTSNKSFLDIGQRSSDWIELYNSSGEDIDMTGFRISDRVDSLGYVFPADSIIHAHGYWVVRCDGAIADKDYAPFSLSSTGGETITLTYGDTVFDQVATPAMQSDLSFARDQNGYWEISSKPTPGYENSQQGYELYLKTVTGSLGDIRITELMVSNLSCIQDKDGDFSDWIELTNFGTDSVCLAGYFLSDQEDKLSKWIFPSVVLAPKERLVVFASSKDRAIDGELHTNFSLNRHKGIVALSTANGQIISSVSYTELEDNVSFAADETTGEWRPTAYATPGYENNEKGYEAFEDSQIVSASLVISEAMTGNVTLLKQGRNGCFDWIELQNQSIAAIDLSKYRITDNLQKTEWCALPERTLAPGECVVLLCTGDTHLARSDYDQIALSLNAKLEQLYLADENGAIIDFITLQGIPNGASIGRIAELSGQFYFSKPSPGEDNHGGYRLISDPPTASVEPGIYSDCESLTISLSAEGAIFYTTNGNVPTEKATRYDEPFTITKTTIVRAVTISEGKMMSIPITLDYFLNTEHTLPIISVTTDEANLYDDDSGILASKNLFDRSVECPANVSFFSDTGSFSTMCGLKLHGAGSRGKLAKKSFKIVFRPMYGTEQLDFPLFEENENVQVDSFLIRNSQDTSRTCLRDELLSKLAIESSKELMVQNTRLCVFYLNGEYQGIYCIKDAFSSGYFSRRYGVSQGSVEVQRGYITEGTAFQQLLDYAASHDLGEDEAYRYIEARVNLESLIDWSVYEAYAANHDLAVNVRYYRSTEYDNNRWHYALFDMDYGFDGPATFDYILANAGHGCLLKNLLKNAEFRELFLKRMAYLLENYLTDENVMDSYNTLKEQIRSEVPQNSLRWGLNKDFGWDQHIASLERFLTSGRTDELKRSIANAMKISLSEVETYFGKENG